MLLGYTDLKKRLQVTETTVECPVIGCATVVRRCRRGEPLSQEAFKCPDHQVYLSPSTFEYVDESRNLLWNESADQELWKAFKSPGVKRECRVARDNSEDAVTWAVFRYLDRQKLLPQFVSLAGGKSASETSRLIPWSYCDEAGCPWPPLVEATGLFGEVYERRSEPDIIIDASDVLIFVEAKFTSGNETTPSDPDNKKRYETAGDGWFTEVFAPGQDYKSVAVALKRYELMRLWLIGSWIAQQQGKRFVLVTLVRANAQKEHDIESCFGDLIHSSSERTFKRVTWEEVYQSLVKPHRGSQDADLLAAYLGNKTMGYSAADKGGEALLRKAFNIPLPGASVSGRMQDA